MRISSIRLQNFKRFTDLTIRNIPDNARLVLLLGVNGSGKSSVFDAFELMNQTTRGDGIFAVQRVTAYYRKLPEKEISIQGVSDSGEFMLGESNAIGRNLRFGKLYGRTSFRQVSRLARTKLGDKSFDIGKDDDRPKFFIDRDNRFENDIEHLSGVILKEMFRSSTSNQEVKQRYIQPINDALTRIFLPTNPNAIQLLEIIPPIEGNVAQITFRKGASEFHYDQLSAGEKEIFNILINLLARTRDLGPALYFLDELDLHLNTELQYHFLKEIAEHWIGEESQLWTATHSLGFIQYAQESDTAAIIDLNALDYDLPQVLEPKPKDRLDVYDVAIPKSVLFSILEGKKLVVCENQNDEYYNLLALPDTLFVGVQDARSVFLTVKRDARYLGLRDRDFLSDDEIMRIQARYPQHRILHYYDFENYLYHPDNLAELALDNFDVNAYRADILAQKTARKDYILAKLVASRMGYEEFKTDEKLRDKVPDTIIEDLASEDFERFYKYFDMKDEYKKGILAPHRLTKERLVSTNWFRTRIEALL